MPEIQSVDQGVWSLTANGWQKTKNEAATIDNQDGENQHVVTVDEIGGMASAPHLSTKRRKVVVDRIYGTSQGAGVQATMHMMFRAPGHFDYVQIIAKGPNTANAIKGGVAAPAQYGDGLTPLDAAGSAITPTAVTWGTTDPDDFANPGGGAATTTITNSSGAESGDYNYVEGQVHSDWIYLPSLSRVDQVGAPPLFMVRLFSTGGVPAVSVGQSNPANANPFTRALPDFRSGFWGTDQATTNTGTGVSGGWFPSVECRFLLRDQRAYVIGFFGDSLDQGDQPGTATPWGGTINGWTRKLVTMLNATVPASIYQCAKTGQWSRSYHNRAFQAIKAQRITHAFIRPWSVNEASTGAAGVTAALQRTSQLIAMCEKYGVQPILVKPGAMGPANEALAATVRTYCDQAALQGVPVLDVSAVISVPGSPSTIKPEYISDVDVVHLNEAGHTAIANAAYVQRSSFGI